MAKKEKQCNLFIYGSLLDRAIFKSVSGYSFSLKPAMIGKGTLLAEQALLPGYRKVSPDNVYYYAVKSANAKIQGLVIHGLSEEAMGSIDKYEGKRYQRQSVQINTSNGPVWAQAYLVSHTMMKKHFGDRWHVNLIHELWLRKRIEQFINKKIRPGERSKDAQMERKANRELLATTERDLVMTHYHSDAVSDYYLEHELDRPRPSIIHIYNDEDARPYIHYYLKLVIKQVLLNQLDERIQEKYRFELERMRSSERFFKRSISLLAALRMMNKNRRSVDMIVEKGLSSMPYNSNDLFDYIKYSTGAVESLFDSRVAESEIDFIKSNFNPGLVPLGAELEFSNLGSGAVEGGLPGKLKVDDSYNGFKYFHDFCLDVLTWKLGGYIDDHSGSSEAGGKSGFLELAPGRLNVKGELSRPATADPWTLNQLINNIACFFDVKPHSLHLSFQMRRHQIGNQKLLPLGFVKCLLALGGGSEMKTAKSLWVSRMGKKEIESHGGGTELAISRTSKRQWYLGENDLGEKIPSQATTYIQQYKFIRLDNRANYEPLIMCLKGLQLSYNPADYITSEQFRKNKRLRDDYEELKRWASEPTEIMNKTKGRFLKVVKDGLMNERHDKPAHELYYIDWALSAIDVQIRLFNKQIRKLKEK